MKKSKCHKLNANETLSKIMKYQKEFHTVFDSFYTTVVCDTQNNRQFKRKWPIPMIIWVQGKHATVK